MHVVSARQYAICTRASMVYHTQAQAQRQVHRAHAAVVGARAFFGRRLDHRLTVFDAIWAATIHAPDITIIKAPNTLKTPKNASPSHHLTVKSPNSRSSTVVGVHEPNRIILSLSACSHSQLHSLPLLPRHCSFHHVLPAGQPHRIVKVTGSVCRASAGETLHPLRTSAPFALP